MTKYQKYVLLFATNLFHCSVPHPFCSNVLRLLFSSICSSLTLLDVMLHCFILSPSPPLPLANQGSFFLPNYCLFAIDLPFVILVIVGYSFNNHIHKIYTLLCLFCIFFVCNRYFFYYSNITVLLL